MSEKETPDCTLLPPSDDSSWRRTKRKFLELDGSLFPPKSNSDAWVRCNGLNSPEQLADLHYALSNRCSHGRFRLAQLDERQFEIAVNHSTLIVPNEGSRQYLLVLLRKLIVRAMRRAWRSGNCKIK